MRVGPAIRDIRASKRIAIPLTEREMNFLERNKVAEGSGFDKSKSGSFYPRKTSVRLHGDKTTRTSITGKSRRKGTHRRARTIVDTNLVPRDHSERVSKVGHWNKDVSLKE